MPLELESTWAFNGNFLPITDESYRRQFSALFDGPICGYITTVDLYTILGVYLQPAVTLNFDLDRFSSSYFQFTCKVDLSVLRQTGHCQDIRTARLGQNTILVLELEIPRLCDGDLLSFTADGYRGQLTASLDRPGGSYIIAINHDTGFLIHFDPAISSDIDLNGFSRNLRDTKYLHCGILLQTIQAHGIGVIHLLQRA